MWSKVKPLGTAAFAVSVACSAAAPTPNPSEQPDQGSSASNRSSLPARDPAAPSAATPAPSSGTEASAGVETGSEGFGPGTDLPIDTGRRDTGGSDRSDDDRSDTGSSTDGSTDPGGSANDNTGAETPATDTPEPVLAPGALIRGDAPTLQSATSTGEFTVQTFTEGLRNGPDYGTQTMHFPVDAEPPFAAVAVVPGFTAPESSIRSWGPFLASHGIVTLTIGTNSPTDSPDVRARALLDALATLKAENTRAGSPLVGSIDTTRLGVMGWSMGGGGTLIASNANPDIRAAITMAAWSPGQRFSADQVPTLLFAGSADNVAGGQSQGFFDSIPPSTPKMLYEVEGGSHSVANSPSGGAGEVGRYGLAWLKVFLESDERFRQFLLQDPTRESEFRENLSSAP